MRIVTYAGAPKAALAIGLALYKKAKSAGAPSARFARYELAFIVATYKDACKEVRITRQQPLIVLHTMAQLAPLYAGADVYAYSHLSLSDTGGGADTSITAIGTTAIGTQSQLAVTQVHPEQLSANPPRANILFGDAASPSLGSYMRPAGRVSYLGQLIKKLKTEHRTNELCTLINSVANSAYGVVAQGYVSPTSDLYTRGVRVLSITNTRSFLGTDASGADVVLGYLPDAYVNSTDAVYPAGGVPPYMLNTLGAAVFDTTTQPDAVLGTTPSSDANVLLNQARYNRYYYAVIPIDKWLEVVCRDQANPADLSVIYAVEQTGLNNTASNPELVVKYVLGGQPHTFTFTQAMLGGVSLTAPWTLSGSIVAGDIPPAQSTGAYTLAGTGATRTAQGEYLITGARFTLAVDNVSFSETLDTVYLPNAMPEPIWRFSDGNWHGHPGTAFYATPRSTLTDLRTGSTTYTVTKLLYGSEAQAYTSTWDIKSYACAAADNAFGVQYALSTTSYTATHASDPTGDKDTANGSWSQATLQSVTYQVTYENGQLVASVVPPAADTVNTSATYVATQSDDGTSSGPYVSSADDVLNATVSTAAEAYMYDGISYMHSAPYAKSASVVQSETATLTSGTTMVSAGLEQDRTLRPWGHNPLAAGGSAAYLIDRLLIRENGAIYPIHAYYMQVAAGNYSASVYINGIRVYDSAPAAYPPPGVALAAGTYEQGLQIANVTAYTGAYTGTNTYTNGSLTNVDRTDSTTLVMSARAEQKAPNISDRDRSGGGYTDGAVWMEQLMYNYPTVGYDRFWLKDSANIIPYHAAAVDAAGVVSSDEGYRLLPVAYGVLNNVTIVHWRGATLASDGICVTICSVGATQYANLLGTYQTALRLGTTSDIAAARSAVDATITVLRNNFASPQVIRYFLPGKTYTILA